MQNSKDEIIGNDTPGPLPNNVLKPLRSILVTPGKAGAKRSAKGKLTWLHGLVAQAIEPRPIDEDRRWSRSNSRKATGFSFDKVAKEEGQPCSEAKKPTERPDAEAAALKSNRDKEVGGDDLSSGGFSDSDDEFAEVEELATKNMRINSAATKISDAEKEANSLDLPLSPLAPSGKEAIKAAKSDTSSFGDSSDGEETKAPPVVTTHDPPAASAFTALPAGSGTAAVKQLRKQDSKSECSSFGDSSGDEK